MMSTNAYSVYMWSKGAVVFVFVVVFVVVVVVVVVERTRYPDRWCGLGALGRLTLLGGRFWGRTENKEGIKSSPVVWARGGGFWAVRASKAVFRWSKHTRIPRRAAHRIVISCLSFE